MDIKFVFLDTNDKKVNSYTSYVDGNNYLFAKFLNLEKTQEDLKNVNAFIEENKDKVLLPCVHSAHSVELYDMNNTLIHASPLIDLPINKILTSFKYYTINHIEQEIFDMSFVPGKNLFIEEL